MKLNKLQLRSHLISTDILQGIWDHKQKNPKTHKETRYYESDTGGENSTVIPTKLKILELLEMHF